MNNEFNKKVAVVAIAALGVVLAFPLVNFVGSFLTVKLLIALGIL